MLNNARVLKQHAKKRHLCAFLVDKITMCIIFMQYIVQCFYNQKQLKGKIIMPEAYTHIRIARGAQKACGITIEDQNAYEMGANGPDPFFCGGIFPHKSKVNMQKLSGLLHSDNCGLFLLCLLYGAKTSTQRSYALGFVMHYATDCVMHPYVNSQILPGGQFNIQAGHNFCESAMDSFFHEIDNGTVNVTQNSTSPVLSAKQLAQISVLLKRAIKYVYKLDLPLTDISDSFNMFRLGHTVNVSPYGVKKVFARFADKFLGTKGALEGHMSPCKYPQQGFAKTWTHPNTNKVINAGPHALCMQSIKLGITYLQSASLVFCGKISPKQISKILGNNSYNTGLPITKKAESEKSPSENSNN